MCGIAGVIGAAGAGALTDTESMLTAMHHRGPDQGGTWQSPQSPGTTFGHRRLSILDLSDAGRQPMIDHNNGVVTVFNGEIYNFQDLRTELEQFGHRFVSTCDTEVILAAYSQWGESCMERLRGMFALAIWDPRSETVLFARDRLGIKPLYFTPQGGRLLFASELRALLGVPGVGHSLDPIGLQSFLWHGFVSGPGTLVQGIELLDPGTVMRVSAGGQILDRRRYWKLPCPQDAGDAAAAVAAVEQELDRTVRMHLLADVPLGIFLSGGVDSSVIAAVAQRNSSRPVVTFNVRFDEAKFDESPYARDVAQRLGTDHREVLLSEQRFAEHLDDAIECLDQPTFDALNTYFVSRAVREAGLTVALAGTGGDELFGGYASFVDLPRARSAATLLGHLPPRMLRGISSVASRILMGAGSEIPAQTRWGKLADLLGTCGDRLGMYQVSYAIFTRDMQRALTLSGASNLTYGLTPDRARELRELIAGQSDLSAISSLELASFIGERLLRDTDSASMAVSLEVRVPLLDHVLLESLTRVPDERRFEPLRRKDLLKHMVREQLPPSVFERKKSGFELPLGNWCRARLADRLEETLQDINLAHAIGLNAETVGRIWRAFKSGDKTVFWSRVWGLYILMNWCRRHGVYAT
jgi:asparagine synthase (glutamine-hydrolysing)